MPEEKDFKAGMSWQWTQTNNHTKLEENKRTQTVVEEGGALKLKGEGDRTMSTAFRFVGNPSAAKPWRVWPLEVGKEWEYDETWETGRGGNVRQVAKVVAYEDVTVPAGTFKAFKIEHKGNYVNPRMRGVVSVKQNDTYWYAPTALADVKHTREYASDNWTRELTSVNAAPAPAEAAPQAGATK